MTWHPILCFISLISYNFAINPEDDHNLNIEEKSFGVPIVPGMGVSNANDRNDFYDDFHRDDLVPDRFNDIEPFDDRYNDNRDSLNNDFDESDLETPCKVLIDNLKDELSRNQATLTIFRDRSSRGSTKVTGLNSFSVNDCNPITRGVLVLNMEFNEITIVNENGGRDLYNHEDRYMTKDNFRNRDRYYNQQDERYDRYDRYSSGGRDRYQYGERDRYYNEDRDRFGNEERDRFSLENRSPMVQVYGLKLEYGYVSDRMINDDRNEARLPFTGVKITMDNVRYRMNAHKTSSPDTDQSTGDHELRPILPELERKLEELFKRVIYGIKDEYDRPSRYRRDTFETLDSEIPPSFRGFYPQRKGSIKTRKNGRKGNSCRCRGKRDVESRMEKRDVDILESRASKIKGSKGSRKNRTNFNDSVKARRRSERLEKRKEERYLEKMRNNNRRRFSFRGKTNRKCTC